jgi:uncharacterized protein (TIGR00369 family)
VTEGQGGADGFDAMVGLEERAVGEGRAEIALVAGPRHLNPAGVVHGGAIATLVDVAMGKAVASLIDDDETPVTIEMKVNYLEAGRPGALVATAEVRRRGRLFTVVQAEVTQEEDGESLAEAMGTFTSTGPPAGQGS